MGQISKEERRRNINVRRQLYKKYRLEGESAYKAAIRAGYAHNTAIHAYTNIDKRIGFDKILVKAGLDDKKVIKVLSEGLDATKVISCNVIAPSGEGMAEAHAKTQDFIDVPDHATRHKFLETLLELRGDKKENNTSSSTVVVNMQSIQIGDKTLEFNIGDNTTAKAS